MGIKINEIGNWNGNGTYVSMSRERSPALPPPVFHPQHTIVVKFKEFKVQKFKKVQEVLLCSKKLERVEFHGQSEFSCCVRRGQCHELYPRDVTCGRLQ